MIRSIEQLVSAAKVKSPAVLKDGTITVVRGAVVRRDARLSREIAESFKDDTASVRKQWGH